MRSDFRFTKFKVYEDSRSLYHQIIKITSVFPRQYWALADQLRRCSLSVILNIAEGSAKKSDKDFNRYLKISLGSINECVACLDIAVNEKLISQKEFESLIAFCSEIAKQLGGFSKSL